MLFNKTKNYLNQWSILIIVVIVIGVFFRFYNLEKKVYWYDETMTSMRVSGYTQTEVTEQVFKSEIIAVQDLRQQYQYPNPQKTLNDTITVLAGNPEHSPLYYLLARFWLQTFGNSIVTLRLLSALISLLSLPCIYGLCLELFRSPNTGWIAVALIAVSPFHVLYAQEAREYSLWTVTILLACVTLLRAIRLKKLTHWTIYGMSIALGLYTHPFSALVFFGQGIYLIILEGFRWTKRLTAYVLASILGLLLFLPWLAIVISHFTKFVENTASVNLSREGFLPLFWGLNLSRIFVDVNQGISPFSPLHYISAFLAGYALYYLIRKTPLEVWLFIITLIGVTGIALIMPDLILGGRRSTITRYAIPCYLGIQVAISYLISTQITANNLDKKNIQRWKYGAIALLLSGIISCIVSSQFPVWWHKSKSKSQYNPQVAQIINQAKNPLVVTDQLPGIVFSLSHLLNPDVHLQLVGKRQIPSIPDNFDPVFLYRPSQRLKNQLARKPNLQIMIEPKSHEWLLNVKKR